MIYMPHAEALIRLDVTATATAALYKYQNHVKVPCPLYMILSPGALNIRIFFNMEINKTFKRRYRCRQSGWGYPLQPSSW